MIFRRPARLVSSSKGDEAPEESAQITIGSEDTVPVRRHRLDRFDRDLLTHLAGGDTWGPAPRHLRDAGLIAVEVTQAGVETHLTDAGRVALRRGWYEIPIED